MTVVLSKHDWPSCELVSQDDRAWFDERPDRILRLRYATNGDPIGPGPGHAVVVFSPVDGVRCRPGLRLPPTMIESLMAVDDGSALALLFWEHIEALEVHVADPDGVVRGKWLRKLLDAALKRGRRLSSDEFLRLTRGATS